MKGLEEAGIVYCKSGRVHLLRRDELNPDWDPETDKRLTVWEATQQLIIKLEKQGEPKASELLKKLGGVADQVKDLAYRLYLICDRKKWADEARSYNSLIVAWPELVRLAKEIKTSVQTQPDLF
jgi:putative DNA methylase